MREAPEPNVSRVVEERAAIRRELDVVQVVRRRRPRRRWHGHYRSLPLRLVRIAVDVERSVVARPVFVVAEALQLLVRRHALLVSHLDRAGQQPSALCASSRQLLLSEPTAIFRL